MPTNRGVALPETVNYTHRDRLMQAGQYSTSSSPLGRFLEQFNPL